MLVLLLLWLEQFCFRLKLTQSVTLNIVNPCQCCPSPRLLVCRPRHVDSYLFLYQDSRDDSLTASESWEMLPSQVVTPCLLRCLCVVGFSRQYRSFTAYDIPYPVCAVQQFGRKNKIAAVMWKFSDLSTWINCYTLIKKEVLNLLLGWYTF